MSSNRAKRIFATVRLPVSVGFDGWRLLTDFTGDRENCALCTLADILRLSARLSSKQAWFCRMCMAVLVMDSGHAILSAIQPETIAQRLMGGKEGRAKQNAYETNGHGGSRSILVSPE